MTAAATHYCHWDAPGGRTVRALCGALIRRRDHANAPTCPRCRAELDAFLAASGPGESDDLQPGGGTDA